MNNRLYRGKVELVKYIYFEFEKEKFYIELDETLYATRQIIIDKDNKVEISCIDCCLAEGKVNVEEFVCKYKNISKSEYEKIWEKYTESKRKDWIKIKEKYPIKTQVTGTIKYFYPQGIIVDFGDTQGCADYNSCRENSDSSSLYPYHIINGEVYGYDENNMWILINNCKAR